MTKKLRYFCTLLLMAVASVAWAEDFSKTYTSNITLSTDGGTEATVCAVTIGSTDYDGLKAGASKKVGAICITVPKGSVQLSMHVAGWKGETVKLSYTLSGTTKTIDLTSNNGIANSSPFAFDGDPSTENYFKTITFSPALTEDTDITFTATSGKRFVVFGVNAASSSDPINPEVSISSANVNIGETLAISYPSDLTTISFSSSDEATATVNESGVVTGVAAGPATITATWTATDSYNAGNKKFNITVVDPNGPGSAANPYTVAQAIDFISDLEPNTSTTNDVYVSGIVSKVDQYVGEKYITYWISDDGTTTTQLEVYKGLGLNGAAFKAITDLGVGDKVTVCGKVKLYKNSSGTVITPQFDPDNKLVSFEGVTRIVADDEVTLEYNATSGEIPFSVLNQGSVSSFKVDLEAGCDWISDINHVTSPITFKTTVNDGSADRSAKITLHHNGAADKVVIVTQKCNPDNVKVVIEEEDKTTFIFNNKINKWELPTDSKVIIETEYTADGYTIKVAGSTGNGFKYDANINSLLIGKEGAYLTLPAFSFPVSKIVVEGNTGASEIVKQNIFVGDKAVSTETTGATGTNTYEIASGNQAAGKIYTLKVTNAYNTQITKIIVYKAEEAAPTSVTVEIGETGYATLYYEKLNLQIPDGVTASIVTGLEGKQLITEELEDVIPAGTGVILEGEKGEYSFNVLSDVFPALGNMLLGTDEEASTVKETTNYYYKFVNEKDGVGFWWGATDGGPFTNGAHKAYLIVPKRTFEGDALAKIFIFGGEGLISTGINQVDKIAEDAAIYNLNGVRVNKVQKGVYVVNGKKVVIK